MTVCRLVHESSTLDWRKGGEGGGGGKEGDLMQIVHISVSLHNALYMCAYPHAGANDSKNCAQT